MKKRIAMILAAALLLSAILAGCTKSGTTPPTPTKPVDKQEVVLNLGTEPPNLDSAKTTDSASFDMLGNTQEGLVRIGEGFKILPGIATDWKTEPAKYKGADGKEAEGVKYTFNLRKDAKWSDGQPVTSKNFAYAWLRALDPETASEYAYQLTDYIVGGEEWNHLDPKDKDYAKKSEEAKKGILIATPDDFTLQVTIKAPTPYFLGLMAFPTYLPQREDIVKKFGDKYAADADKLVYNGPFMITGWTHDDNIVMVKNPTYWDAKSVKLAKATFKMIKDANTAIQMFEAGELDEVGLPGEFIPKYQSQPGFSKMASATTNYMSLNQKKKELQNVKIRQALSLALDRKGFVDSVLKNGSIPSEGYTPPSIAGDGGKSFRAISGSHIPPNGDKAKAKQLWEEGLKELGITKLTLKLLSSDTSTTKRYTQGIQEMLQTALPGLTVELEPVAFKVRLERTRKGDFDFVFQGWIGDYNDPMTFMNMFVSGGPYNDPGWSNKQYDELIKKAMTDSNNANRMKYMADAEKLLMQEMPLIPIYHPSSNWITKPYLKGILNFPLGAAMDLKGAFVEGRAK